jgi:hypothetical protein
MKAFVFFKLLKKPSGCVLSRSIPSTWGTKILEVKYLSARRRSKRAARAKLGMYVLGVLTPCGLAGRTF